MTIEKACDIILSNISEYPDNLYSIEDVLNKKDIPIELKGKCLSMLMAKNFIKTTPTKQGTLIKVTPEGVVFSLHSSFEREKKTSINKATNQSIAKIGGIAFKILSAIGIIGTLYFNWSNNQKQKEIDSLKSQSDSLTKIIPARK